MAKFIFTFARKNLRKSYFLQMILRFLFLSFVVIYFLCQMFESM